MQKILTENQVKVIIPLKLLEVGQRTQKLNKFHIRRLLMKVLLKGMMKKCTQNKVLVQIKEVKSVIWTISRLQKQKKNL